jgi:2',3'-cyclic-nucleotide 2'-phosphodiesterase
MRILFAGDIVSSPGRSAFASVVREWRAGQEDFVLANAENAAGGNGLTPALAQELFRLGADALTLGDHAWDKKEIYAFIEDEYRLIRPANYPSQCPGSGWTILEKNGLRICLISLVGRVFMPPVDCPFRAVDQILENLSPEVKVVLVDFHAEATSDMQLMGRHLDGRVSAVLGTHTHVPTADERILPQGTAFQCDVGMTGAQESILGRRIDRVLQTTRTFRPTHYEVATEDPRIQGTLVDVDESTGRATAVRRVEIDAEEAESLANHAG